MDDLTVTRAISDFDKAVVELLRASGWLHHVHNSASGAPAAAPELLAAARDRLEAITLQPGVFDHLYHEAA
ncbi:hypothetical protein ABIA39_005215 [Nocardia sp. GAS34]|uniref:hypothetical protein n=1 Tax=unclassified Nocardia TaxID=2637762 RepID=UPI003D19DBE7